MKSKQTEPLTLRRAVALLLVLLMALTCLASCTYRAIPAGKGALRSVGLVGGEAVTYEEFYFLCRNYRDELDDTLGEGNYTAEDVMELVSEYVVANPIVLAICRDAGLEYDEDALRAQVDDAVKDQIVSDHGDDRAKYIEWLNATHMTDHYYRYSLGVSLLYGRLLTAYLENGTIPADDAEMLVYAKENFVRTRHIAIYFDENDEEARAEKLARAEAALATVRERGFSAGMQYSEDFGLATADSYYLFESAMEPEYATAVHALGAGEISGIVESRGTNAQGAEMGCFYVIERLSMEDKALTAKLDQLRDDACDAIAYEKYERYLTELRFVPNAYCKSLDLMKLEAPERGADPLTVGILAGVGIGVAVIALTVVTVVVLKKRQIAKRALLKKKP